MKIALVGSEKFRKLKTEIIQQCIAQDHKVFDCCNLYKQLGSDEAVQDFIKDADLLYVATDGCIGDATTRYINFAFSIGKTVISSEEIPQFPTIADYPFHAVLPPKVSWPPS